MVQEHVQPVPQLGDSLVQVGVESFRVFLCAFREPLERLPGINRKRCCASTGAKRKRPMAYSRIQGTEELLGSQARTALFITAFQGRLQASMYDARCALCYELCSLYPICFRRLR